MLNRLGTHARLMGLITLGAVTLSTSGCSSLFGDEGYFRDRGDDYLRTDVIEPMKLPEGVLSTRVSDLYAIPAVQKSTFEEVAEFEVPRPQALSANAFTDKVKIQKLGDSRWILINVNPSQAWPKVRQFLAANGLSVSNTDATNGLIETAWLKFKDDEGSRDKYRLRIEQGVQPDTSEIHALHIQVKQSVADSGSVGWPDTSHSTERENWMLDELASALASDESTGQSASLLASTIGVGSKVDLAVKEGEPLLVLNLDGQRAWATVAASVSKGGFTPIGNNREAGIFYVDYAEINPEAEDDELGFFAKMLGGGDENEDVSTYTIDQVLAQIQPEENALNRTLFAKVQTGQPAIEDVLGYLVLVSPSSQRAEVRIRDAHGRVLSTKQAKQLLNIIRRNLI
jgi:outer membrane protein assembly factor BamC